MIKKPGDQVQPAGDLPSESAASAEHAIPVFPADSDVSAEAKTLAERGRRLRFLWEIAADGRFSVQSPEFLALLGAGVAAELGQNWTELAAELGLDPDGHIVRAVGSRESFTGILLAWPVGGTPERITVELSGAPHFDRNRTFLGYRGFGICHPPGSTAPPTPRQPSVSRPTETPAPLASSGPAAPASERPQLTSVPAAPNVVPFRPLTPHPRPVLTAVEHSAFQEIARTLGVQVGRSAPSERSRQAGTGSDSSHPQASSEAPAAARPAPPTDKPPPLFPNRADVVPSAYAAIVEGAAIDMRRAAALVAQWRSIEAELLAAKKQAEKASATKSGFLAAVSHEVRTLMTAVIGFAEVLVEERFGRLGNDHYRQYVRDIHYTGTQVVSLVSELLDLAKIEAGKLELTFEAIDLNELVKSCVSMMQPQANRGRILIRSSLAPGLRPITVDQRTVRQVLLNLLSNAIKFTGAAGQIIVSTGQTNAGEVVLRVRDTGIGMTETELAVALEPFGQVLPHVGLSTDSISPSDEVLKELPQVPEAPMLKEPAKAGAGLIDQDAAADHAEPAVAADQASEQPRLANTDLARRGTGLGLPLAKALTEANHARFIIKSAVDSGTLVEIIFPGPAE